MVVFDRLNVESVQRVPNPARLLARSTGAGVFALALLCLVLRGPTFGFSELGDESAFAIVAREILNGCWPYTTVFDHKPIALYLHFAAAIAIFGDDPTTTRILGWAVVTATAVAARAIMADAIGLARARAFIFAAALIVAELGFGGQAVLSEHIANLYLTLSALFILRGRRRSKLLGGFFAGIAANCNYLAVPIIVGLVAGYVAKSSIPGRERVRDIGLFAVGAAVAVALLLMPIYLFSDLAGYFTAQYAFLSGYSGTATIAERLLSFATQASPLIPVAATALAVTALSAPRGIRDAFTADPLRPFVGMLIGAAAATRASGYVFPNYMTLLLPPLVLWVGVIAHMARDRSQRLFLDVSLIGTVLATGMPGLVESAIGLADLAAKATKGDNRFDEARQIAQIASENLPRGRTVYAVCSPLVVYQLLHVRPPTRYPVVEQLLVPRFAAALGVSVDQELKAVFSRHPAVVILGDVNQCWDVPPQSWKQVAASLRAEHYREYARFHDFSFFEAPR